MPTAADLEGIVDAALDAVGDEARWSHVLARLRRSFASGAAALIAHDFATGRGRWCLADGLDPGMAATYASRWAGANPWLAAAASYVPGRAILGEALVRSHDLVRTSFYADYLQPMGCYHRLAGTIVRAGSRLIYLALHRPPGAPSFELPELRALEWLLSRLARPVLLHRELLQRCSGTEAFRALLDQVPHALFLVDGELRPVAMNAAAAVMAEASSPMRVVAGRLVFGRGEEDEALRRAVRAVLAGGNGRPGPVEFALRRDGDLQPVLLRVARLGAHHGLADAPEELVLILAIDPEARRGQPAMLAARLWGLTSAEARLCHLLARGLRPGEAARELGLSPHTVHAQLRQIFAKAGVHRQAELLRLLERLCIPPS